MDKKHYFCHNDLETKMNTEICPTVASIDSCFGDATILSLFIVFHVNCDSS